MRKTSIILLTIIALFVTNTLLGQNITVEGYAFEDDNRGYLNEVSIKITDLKEETTFCEVYSDRKGFFTCELPANQDFKLLAVKDVFQDVTQDISTKNLDGEKLYVKVKMNRSPGYLLDVTLAEALTGDATEVDAIQGARIEIYNNTKKKEGLVLEDHPFPTFQYTLEKGNHYTIMIRKEGFFTKRIEAYVDIDGCILCMDGVNEIAPGVSDNLTEGHDMGTLLANIELERAEVNKSIEIKNIYYEFNSANITREATKELDKLVYLLKNNPEMIVELGSHTDSRGRAEYNQNLSQKRAQSAVDYIISKGDDVISKEKIKAKGYGETQLVNNCKDGVNCSEEEHQQNRRTELKIVGYTKAKEEQKSLAEIIEAEQFEIMLQEVMNQEVVKIGADGKLPLQVEQEIKEQQDEQNIQRPEEPKIIPAETTKPTKKVKKSTTPITIIKKAENEVASPVQAEVKEPTQTQVKTDSFTDKKETQPNGQIIGEQKIIVNAQNKAVPVPIDYTGYRVEIWKSDRPLSPNHQIFTQHGNIAVGVTRNNIFSYMLGNFDFFETADNYRLQTLTDIYPKAKVIQYKNGERLDY